MNKPKIICMCGSTKFGDLMAAISWELEKLGNIVLRVNHVPEWYVNEGGLTAGGNLAEQQGVKKELDELHCRKIDLCDEVYVCNLNGYIGESTQNEIEYAEKVGKSVFFMVPIYSHTQPVQNELDLPVVKELVTWRDDFTIRERMPFAARSPLAKPPREGYYHCLCKDTDRNIVLILGRWIGEKEYFGFQKPMLDVIYWFE